MTPHSQLCTPVPTTVRLVQSSSYPVLQADRLGTAVFGAGCFWGPELAFQRVPGVVGTATGYCQGHVPEPTYDQVCTGETGHAEVVQVCTPAILGSRAASCCGSVKHARLKPLLHGENTFRIHGPGAGQGDMTVRAQRLRTSPETHPAIQPPYRCHIKLSSSLVLSSTTCP